MDIRVSIVMPEARGKVIAQQQELHQEINETQAALDQVTSLLSDAYSRLAAYRAGTTEAGTATTSINRLLYNRNVLQDTLLALQERFRALFADEPRVTTKVLAECQTVAISTYRDKRAVRAFGSVYPKGFTRGSREIAGSMVFTVFNDSVLYEFLEAHPSDFDAHVGVTSALLDQIPPFDLLLSFANEYGAVSRMTIKAVEFLSEGMVMSIEDILTENQTQFIARDYDPIRSVSQRKVDENNRLISANISKRASDLILEEDYQRLKDKLSPYGRQRKRFNPFI